MYPRKCTVYNNSSNRMMASVQWCFLLLQVFILICAFFSASCHGAPSSDSNNILSICRIPGCNCTAAVSPSWSIVNCTFNSSQMVSLDPGSIPNNTMELSVIGGEKLEITSHAFANIHSLHRIRVDGTKKLFIKKFAFLNITSAKILLQIYGCEYLYMDAYAFKSIKGPITAEISKCFHVTIKQSALNWLQEGKFQEISHLDLWEDTFSSDSRDNREQRHGPVTMLLFENVVIPNIPKNVFHSSMAEIRIKDSFVNDIHAEAFHATMITTVAIVNSTIHRIRSGAFHDGCFIGILFISKSKIDLIESDVLMGACNNLTVEHSNITEIRTSAINSTIANIIVTDNNIVELNSRSFIFNSWNKISFNNNVLQKMHSNAMELPINPSSTLEYEFSFVGNEIYHVEERALVFISDIENNNLVSLKFDDNYINETCQCDIADWLKRIFGTNDSLSYVLNTSFCNVNDLLSRCFQLPVGLINMSNFTKLVCASDQVIKCEPYSGDTKIIDSVNKKFSSDRENNNNLIVSLMIGFLVLAAVCGTLIILLVRGSLWLKRNGYCQRFRNLRYRNDAVSTEAEDIMVTISEKIPEEIEEEEEVEETVPEELTQELLQALREKLEDPLTYNEAREMIERLYDQFIVEDSYVNNNKQEEEAHLYEELGNLAPNPPPPAADLDKNANRPFSFLRLIEERFNLVPTDVEHAPKPAMLVSDYAEPTDAEVHLYSELLQAKQEVEPSAETEIPPQGGSSTTNSHRSNASGRMAFRPLPAKPKADNDPGEGPSTKY